VGATEHDRYVAVSNVIHSKLGKGRGVAIPFELCQRYGLEPGGPVVLDPSDIGIVVRRLDPVFREVKAFFAYVRPEHGLQSEELIREHREEAAREGCG
jgi:bifunctional DNA-binding transcriptional regulator/antitoxin component of YhaV-PrlF toxin-antitoxin module